MNLRTFPPLSLSLSKFRFKKYIYILLCFPKMQTPTFYIFLLDEKFEILTVGLHILYVLNTHVKFRSNRILFIIQSINLFLCIILDPKNLKFKHLINYITINFLYS